MVSSITGDGYKRLVIVDDNHYFLHKVSSKLAEVR